MGTYFIQDTTLFSIADAIRTKLNTSSMFTPAQMVAGINKIPTQENDLIQKNYSGFYENDRITTIGSHAFQCCNFLSANFPNVTKISLFGLAQCSLITASLPLLSIAESQAFFGCRFLQTIDLPSLTIAEGTLFSQCYQLSSVSLPLLAILNNNYTFGLCYALSTISLPSLLEINGSRTFNSCYNLLSLYLLNSSVCALAYSNIFISTPFSDYTVSTSGQYGSIYVPASLYHSYITAENWSYYSSRFVGI